MMKTQQQQQQNNKNRKKNQNDRQRHKLFQEVILKEGRNKCECQGFIHKVINNCLYCGRIVCEQEGQGSCFFCGNTVLDKTNKQFPELQKQQYQQVDGEIDEHSKMKAIEHKNKLVNYDKSDTMNKQIIDEQTDWYSIADDIWQKNENRDQAVQNLLNLKTKIAQEQSMIGIYHDGQQFQSNQVDVDEIYNQSKQQAQQFQQEINQDECQINIKQMSLQDQIKKHQQIKKQEEQMQEIKQQQELQNNIHNKQQDKDYKLQLMDDNVKQIMEEQDREIQQKYKQFLNKENPMVAFKQLGKKVQHDDLYSDFEKAFVKSFKNADDKVYDKQLFQLEKYQDGNCLSMHQPWASLLMEGIKRFEGRYWKTNYRGPLWIHSTSQQPSEELIQQIESQYKQFYKEVNHSVMVQYPQRYPTSCLLGVVDLQTILDRKQYEQIEPQYRENSDCEFIFVVRNPRKLIYPVRMSGNKDIYKLNPDLYMTIKNQIHRVRTNWWPYIMNDYSITSQELKNSNSIDIQKAESQSQSEYTDEQQQQQQQQQVDNSKIQDNMSYANDKFYGSVVNRFLSNDEMSELVTELQVRSISVNNKALNQNMMQQIDLDVSFPYLEQIFNAVPNNRKKLLKSLKYAKFFFVNQKTKQFIMNNGAIMILYIGCQIVLELEDEKQNKQDKFKSGSLIIKNNNVDIKYDSIMNESLKHLQFNKEQKGLFVYFYKQ